MAFVSQGDITILAITPVTSVRLHEAAKKAVLDAAERGHKSQSDVMNDLAVQFAHFLYIPPSVSPPPEIRLGLRHRDG
jgi:hypothetical protein